MLRYTKFCRRFFILTLMLIKANAGHSSNIENFSTFKRMDLYKLESTYPEQYCLHFVCESSGLSAVRIAQIIDKENEIRNDFANSNVDFLSLSLKEWSPLLANFARRKALLCLYRTDEENVIFETQIFEEWFGSNVHSKFPKPVAIEVVMEYQVEPINNRPAIYLYDQLEDALGEFFFREQYFNNPSAIRRRGSVLQMGCDYVVRNNKTHLITHLVCAYGVLYFSNGVSNDYSAVIGTPCSKCQFYVGRTYFRTTSTVQQWGCLSTFPFLCGDLALTSPPVDSFRHDCNKDQTTSATKPGLNVVTSVPLDVEGPTRPPHEWPCLKYAIPLMLLICIMIVAILYQTYSIIAMKLNFK